MTIKCAACGGRIPDGDIEPLSGQISNEAGTFTAVLYFCFYCRMDSEMPLPVKVVTVVTAAESGDAVRLSSCSNLNKTLYSDLKETCQ